MATSAKSDFDIFQSLWQNINDICVPKPPPGAPAKACFLMEMPGFSIDPKAYDPAQFDPSTMSSPDMEVATLCDRIPAIASYFYDTGDHISFLWNQLLTTYHVKPSPAGEDEAAKNNYDDALEMLYGGRDGYIKQTKTPLFANLEVLRKKWQDAMDARERFRTECLNDSKKWPKNFQDNAGPYNDQVDQEYTSYNNLRREIEKYEASILRYSTGDLTTLMLEQQNGMAMNRKTDAGKTGLEYQQTILEPSNWYTWFNTTKEDKTKGDKTEGDKTEGDKTEGDKTEGDKTEGDKTEGDKTEGDKTEGDKTEGDKTEGDKTEGDKTEGDKTEGDKKEGDKSKDDKDAGWTKITINQVHKYESSHTTMSQVSVGTEVSYGGLFYSGGVSGGFDKQSGNSELTAEGSNLVIEFSVRKVLIQRPWFQPIILKYPTLGIKGVKTNAWSSGELGFTSNKGSFPILPTAFIVAKDVKISADSFSSTVESSFSEMKSHASVKVGIGCFSLGGNFSHSSSTEDSSATYDSDSHTIEINGAQIIGWVCVANPAFPQYSSE